MFAFLSYFILIKLVGFDLNRSNFRTKA